MHKRCGFCAKLSADIQGDCEGPGSTCTHAGHRGPHGPDRQGWPALHLPCGAGGGRNRDAAPDADSYYARIASHPLALKVKQADLDDNADPQRLAMLDAATAGRLRGKYAHARAALGI